MKEKRKNVHAGIKGFIDQACVLDLNEAPSITYNPYKYETFVNKETEDPAKVIKHVEWYAEYFTAVTGRSVTTDDLIEMSEAVYNFQRIFNLKMGFGKREHDKIPYRAMGPVTADEYESRKEHYDKQLEEKYDIDTSGRDTAEKCDLLRTFREEQYEKLQDAVYHRRGWTQDGIPTIETVRRLGIDFPDVMEVLKAYGVE